MPCTRAVAARCLRALLAAVLLSGGLAGAAAQGAYVPTPILLGDKQEPIDARALGGAWLDTGGAATLEQVLRAGTAPFRAAQPDVIHSLGAQQALWLHFRVARGPRDSKAWQLAFPMPALDSVTTYQQDGSGQWVGQTGGDNFAVASWPAPGRYPHFRLELRRGQMRDVYVRIRHYTPSNFPVQLVDEVSYTEHSQLEYLGLGLAFGALLLLVAACLAQSLVYRDRAYAWYASYAVITAGAVAAYTGVAAHVFWPAVGALGDSPQGALALLAAAAALLFVRNLAGIAPRHHILDRLAYAAGVAGIVLAVLFPALDKAHGLATVAAYVAGATLASLWIAWAAWRRADAVGGWVLLAYLPFALAVGMALARMLGWLPVSFGTQYALVVAMAIEVPLLLVALNIRSRERHGAQIRELALSSQDALTGLLSPHLFQDRMRQVVARYKRDRENAAIVFIDLVNYKRIKDNYGAAVAEQSLLRSVIKLRRLVREVDTVGRVGEARFGLILEGITSRFVVTDRAARLIAAGLTPLTGLKPDVTLQFHIGAVLLRERMMEAPDIAAALDELLGRMSPRTRRPIRFLEPEVTLPAPLEADSSLLAPESQLPGDAVPAVSRSASGP
jgi:diguanylate cyclase (GGDEF)-like protein